VPEGDTIFRAARTLNRALASQAVVRFESAYPALTRVHEDTPITGRLVERVTAAGKHVLMHFSGDLVLRTHMRMNGSWHIYRSGEAWKRPRRDMRILIATAPFVAVAFNVTVAEFLQGAEIGRQQDLRLMGPDLLGDEFDIDEAVHRLRERATTAIADALLNQRVVAASATSTRAKSCSCAASAPSRAWRT
jgi:endonuclease-8